MCTHESSVCIRGCARHSTHAEVSPAGLWWGLSADAAVCRRLASLWGSGNSPASTFCLLIGALGLQMHAITSGFMGSGNSHPRLPTFVKTSESCPKFQKWEFQSIRLFHFLKKGYINTTLTCSWKSLPPPRCPELPVLPELWFPLFLNPQSHWPQAPPSFHPPPVHFPESSYSFSVFRNP